VRQPWAGAGRGSTRRWRERRRWVLKDSPLCLACQAEGRVALATEIDHVVPVARGGTDDYPNLQPLCSAHHRAKTQREQRRGGA
jgi:5-methylcytosine-specific restriction protein A